MEYKRIEKRVESRSRKVKLSVWFLLVMLVSISFMNVVSAGFIEKEVESANISKASLWMGQQSQAGQVFEFSQDLYVYRACVMFKYRGDSKRDVFFSVYETEYNEKYEDWLPSIRLLTQEIMPASEIDKEFKLRCVNFSSPVELKAGKKHALVLSSPDSSSKSTYLVRRSGPQDPYPSGAWVKKYSDAAKWQRPGRKYDLVFSVFGGSLAQEESQTA